MKWFRRMTVTTAVLLLFVLCFTAAYADGSTLRMPDDVQVIEEEAFYGDTSLDEVVLPLGVEAIGPRAFAYSSLHQINLPDSLRDWSIADDAFDNSQLQYVIVNYSSSAANWAREHESSLGYEIIYDSGENSVTSGPAHDVTATAAWVPLTYSVDVNTAERGYRMGVAYSEDANDIGVDNDGYLTCMEWTWGGESDIYGPANHAFHEGWLDEMIPEHTYYYSGCIVDNESSVIFLEDAIHSFTTGSASLVIELSLDGEHGFAPCGYTKTPFRFTAPAEGWYAVLADKPVDEMSVRRMDDRGCGMANDSSLLTFFAGENETVYVFTRDFSEDAEIWVEVAEVPDSDYVISEVDISGDKPVARVTLDISGSTAQYDYGFGIEYSPIESFQDENGNTLANDFFWNFGDYRVRSNETVESDVSNLIPGVTYYYRGFIDYCNGQPRLVEDEVHSFTAPGNVEDIPALTLEEWSNIPANQNTLFRFTAQEVGWYAVQAEGMYYFNILQTDGTILRGTNEIENNDHQAVLIVGMGDGETCYISTNGMEGAQIRVTQDSSVFFHLSGEPQWVWDNHYFCFTAPEAGWYNLKVDRPDFGGMRAFANLPLDELSFWLDFHDDVDTQSIHAMQAGDTFYFITWYDMNRGEQMVSVTPITPPEEDSIAVTDVQISDTSVKISLNYSISAATQEIACQRWGYQVGIVYSDGEIWFDDNDDYHIEESGALYTLNEDWSWDSRFSIEDNATLTRCLDRLIPGMTYYWFAYIRDAQTGEFFAHTQPAGFTTGSASSNIVTLELGRNHEVNVPEGNSVYRFVPEETAIYAVVSSGLENLEIRGYNGRWIAGDENRSWDNSNYPYCQGFIGEAGEEYYIFVGNHFDGITLYVGYGDDELPELTDHWVQWYDGRQVFRYTPSESGWYRFVFDGTDQGELAFAEPDRMDDNSGWPRYGEGNEITRWLEAGQTVYPGCWFDNVWAWVYMTVTRVLPANEPSVYTLDVQDVTDVRASFGMQLGMPVLDEGANYTYGVQLMRCNNDPSFTGGSAWEQTNADMSMVVWNQTAPLEQGYQHFFDERPLEPSTQYWYEAFVGVYDPVENRDNFYYGGLKSFTTVEMQHTVTQITENQIVNVPGIEGDYQFFDFTIPEQEAADFYDVTVPESSIWVIQPNGNALWPDWTDRGLHCVFPGKGNEGQTFRICLMVWNNNGTSFSVQPIYSQNVNVGSGQALDTGSIYSFTTPTDGEYLIAATDGGRINVSQPEYDGFNHQSGWGWITDSMKAGETVVFRCEQDNGKPNTEVVITPLENAVTTESELRSAVAAANQIAQIRPYFEGFNIYVKGDIALSQDLELSTVVQLYLNAALTVSNGVTLTDHSDIYIEESGNLTVVIGGWLSMEGIVNEYGDPEWWATINLDGGTFTENGVLWIDQAAIISVDDQNYNGELTQALSSIGGSVTVPTNSIQLFLGADNDAKLQQALELMQSYRYVGVRLINGYSPSFSNLTGFTMDKSHIIADSETVLSVPAGTTQTLHTTLQLAGAALTVDGTLNIGDENDDGWLIFSDGGAGNSFLNNGVVNVDDGSGITWYGAANVVNNGTMNFADNSILRLSQRDGAVKYAEVNNTNGTVNLGILAEWSEGISFAGGTINQST